MTTQVAPPRVWHPRGGPEVLADQLRGIAAWNATRRAIEHAEGAIAPRSREMRLDVDRRLAVIRRQHEALIRTTEQQLAASARVTRAPAPARALVVHRSEWFTTKLVEGLVEGGIDVVGRLENGADAVGVSVAEQPDLLVLEDKLPMVSGEEVIRQLRELSPMTMSVLQVSFDDDVASALEAGARAAFTRRVPPGEVAREVCQLVSA